MPGPKFRGFIEDRENVDTLLLMLRGVVVPEGFTGEVTLNLHYREGRICQGKYAMNNLLLRAPSVMDQTAPGGVRR